MSQPRRFYWKQCYELNGQVHWALCDTQTDVEAPPTRITSAALILEAHHPTLFGRPTEDDYWLKLIAELLNAHFANQKPATT